jgi:hypothetical protein
MPLGPWKTALTCANALKGRVAGRTDPALFNVYSTESVLRILIADRGIDGVLASLARASLGFESSGVPPLAVPHSVRLSIPPRPGKHTAIRMCPVAETSRLPLAARVAGAAFEPLVRMDAVRAPSPWHSRSGSQESGGPAVCGACRLARQDEAAFNHGKASTDDSGSWVQSNLCTRRTRSEFDGRDRAGPPAGIGRRADRRPARVVTKGF